MTRWPRRHVPVPEEPPSWVRCFDPEAWRDDDADEPYLAGALEAGFVGQYHAARDWHAQVRWNDARLAWYRAHPAAADAWVWEIVASLGVPE